MLTVRFIQPLIRSSILEAQAAMLLCRAARRASFPRRLASSPITASRAASWRCRDLSRTSRRASAKPLRASSPCRASTSRRAFTSSCCVTALRAWITSLLRCRRVTSCPLASKAVAAGVEEVAGGGVLALAAALAVVVVLEVAKTTMVPRCSGSQVLGAVPAPVVVAWREAEVQRAESSSKLVIRMAKAMMMGCIMQATRSLGWATGSRPDRTSPARQTVVAAARWGSRPTARPCTVCSSVVGASAALQGRAGAGEGRGRGRGDEWHAPYYRTGG